jgi:hypothetical protein
MAAVARLKIDQSDGSSQVVTLTPLVIVAAERNFGCAFSKIVGEEGTMERTYWVAWKASQVAGNVVEPFDEWLGKITGIDTADDAPSLPLEAP